MRTIIKYITILALSFILFLITCHAANLERGYNAIGGELCILLLPLLWYAAEAAVRGVAECVRVCKSEMGI